MIVLENLSKRFDRAFVVDGITINIAQGEIVGLLGPNGAGKTTTLRMIAGVLPPTKGTVTINGKGFKYHAFDLKKRIGFLPENNPLYDELTVEEHLKFWSDVKEIPINKRPEAQQFVIDHTGIGDVLYRPIGELSKGYQQRVGLSQAILTKPDVLILDEPTEGLDPNQRREIQTLIQTLGAKRTVIVSSHVLSEIARICNRIIIIHRGKIVADDTPEKLKRYSTSKQIVEAEILGTGVSQGIKTIKGVQNVTAIGAHYYSIEVKKDEDIREQLFKMAVSKKWTLLTLVKKDVALEDIFSQLTKE